MNQPLVPTAAPVPTIPVLPSKPRNWKKIILIALSVVLAIALVVGVYFLGTSVQSKKDADALKAQEAAIVPVETPSPSPVPKIAPGFTKAQTLMNQGGKTIIRSVLQISYSGVLKAADPGRSWTVEKEGKSVTIVQEGSGQIQYFLFGGQNPTGKSVDASELGVGDNVTIIVFVDAPSGAVSVNSIVFVKKV